MRLVPLLALCLALPALAQTPPPEAFYPLAIGDVREYRGTGPASTPYPRYTSRESVVGDTLAGGVHYRLVERLYLEDGQPLVRSRHAVRFDTAAARPVERLPDGTEVLHALCRLDLADPCANDLGVEPVQIGSDVTERAVRSAFNLVATERYAAGIGLVARETDDGADYVERLTFARVGDTVYGSPSEALPLVWTPDPTPPWQYWPLAVGNVWEYARCEPPTPFFQGCEVVGHFRRTIVRDTLVGGRRYFIEQSTLLSGQAPLLETRVLRFDTTTATVRQLGASGSDGPITCRLDTDFGRPVECGHPNPWPEWALVSGGDGFKFFPFWKSGEGFLAGAGYLVAVSFTISGGEYRTDLTFARIDGVSVFGQPYVTTEPPPSTTALTLAVSPNPTAGAAVLTLSLPAPAHVVVEAFDALGRRVLSTDADASAGETRLAVDAHGWAPGLYLVRATTDGGAAATTRLVRR